MILVDGTTRQVLCVFFVGQLVVLCLTHRPQEARHECIGFCTVERIGAIGPSIVNEVPLSWEVEEVFSRAAVVDDVDNVHQLALEGLSYLLARPKTQDSLHYIP